MRPPPPLAPLQRADCALSASSPQRHAPARVVQLCHRGHPVVLPGLCRHRRRQARDLRRARVVRNPDPDAQGRDGRDDGVGRAHQDRDHGPRAALRPRQHGRPVRPLRPGADGRPVLRLPVRAQVPGRLPDHAGEPAAPLRRPARSRERTADQPNHPRRSFSRSSSSMRPRRRSAASSTCSRRSSGRRPRQAATRSHRALLRATRARSCRPGRRPAATAATRSRSSATSCRRSSCPRHSRRRSAGRRGTASARTSP